MARKRIVYGNAISHLGLYSTKPVSCAWDVSEYWDKSDEGTLSVPEEVNEKLQTSWDDTEKHLVAYSTDKKLVSAWAEGVKSFQMIINAMSKVGE